MKKLFFLVLLLCVFSCGQAERIYDKSNYESLTNEIGDIEVFSGGKVVATYRGAKILYSSADTQAMWVQHDGKEYYLQGDCIIEIK